MSNKTYNEAAKETMDKLIDEWRNAPTQFVREKPVKIKYEQLFPTASYLNCRIGFETEISDLENPMQELSRLKNIAQAFHMKEFPQFYEKEKPIYQGEEFMPEIQIEKKPEGYEKYLQDVENCKTIEDLESMRVICAMNPKLQDAFNERMKALKLFIRKDNHPQQS